MNKRFSWKALFTQSGSEIYQISKQLGRFPDSIITNKSPEKMELINPKLLNEAFDRLVFIPRIPTIEEYNTALNGSDDIITLHGYLRILPGELCGKRIIYNGHPGLITRYPDLKGKDPQQRAWNAPIGTYASHGHVIHKVVAEVDAGEVSSTMSYYCTDLKAQFKNFDNYVKSLHDLSINNWVDFIKKRSLINKA